MTSKIQLEIVGLSKDPTFQIAKCTAEELKQRFPSSFEGAIIRPLVEFDWHTYLTMKKQELKGEVWEFRGSVMCFENGRLLGNEEDLTFWAEKRWSCTSSHPQELCVTLSEDYFSKQLQSTGHTFVYMDIEISEKPAGRLLIELFSVLCPKTCKNFQALCTGEEGLSYKGSLFHRIVPNGWIQGGDISLGSRGNGGESIYGPTFEDESFAVAHCKRGILGMANQGPHTNGSQFYITLQPAPWMDRNQVIEGTEVLKKMEDITGTENKYKTQDTQQRGVNTRRLQSVQHL
ncbi:probable inactive peptidyl-prolyl cis-trans isomerase-like 6 isoform X2 [Paramormyrops kingsleyae]|uniref:probable inactive peptidyl-prolyl cis-trans isomerase-like 6 isoform X2 n=1 Tax=Paramormyrops kingsleyae TaxID=1676925 RepID=UPI000CD631A6|nr:peptidyl-prolyl cis-trans isomerase-like 6 isoform X2 [Paramormyrops kingsleyae]